MSKPDPGPSDVDMDNPVAGGGGWEIGFGGEFTVMIVIVPSGLLTNGYFADLVVFVGRFEARLGVWYAASVCFRFFEGLAPSELSGGVILKEGGAGVADAPLLAGVDAVLGRLAEGRLFNSSLSDSAYAASASC